MDLSFFYKGLVIGFSIAAPVGPIGVLCIRRTLAGGWRVGFITGLGAATADAAYGCVAGFGLTAVSSFIISQRFFLTFIGGIFLCYLGIRTFVSHPSADKVKHTQDGLLSAYLSTLLLTMSNPTTILSFIAVFAGIDLGVSPDYQAASLLISGVFIGSVLWWLSLSGGVGILRLQFRSRWMQAINWLSGGFIFAFGLYVLAMLRFR